MKKFFLGLLMIFWGTNALSAQVFNDFDKPVAGGEVFCKLLGTLSLNASAGFAKLIDNNIALKGTPVKKSFWLPGAVACHIDTLWSGRRVFATFFMATFQEEIAIASFNNLIHQVQDCLPQSYKRVNKKPTFLSRYFPAYNAELSYNGNGLKSDKPIYHIFIFHDRRRQTYQLRMEISEIV